VSMSVRAATTSMMHASLLGWREHQTLLARHGWAGYPFPSVT
jgi:hypothetical protein